MSWQVPRLPVRVALAAGTLVVVTAFLLLQQVSVHAATVAPRPIALNSSSCPADIQEGQISGCVTTLQEDLNRDDNARLAVDGDFGPLTLAAVKTYQSRHGLSVDGIVGPQTKASLLGSTSTHGAPAPIALNSSSCPADIQEGQVSGCVTTLQKDLNKDDNAGLTVDGDFGPLTLAAVKAYQSRHGLSVDGIVGPQTKASLLGGHPAPPPPPPPSGGGVHDYPGTGLSTNYDWARLVLRDGGWPQSSNNVTVITQWMTSEEPTSNWFDRDNPLNNGLGSGGGAGLGSYPNLHTAAYYVAKNLSTGQFGYGAVVKDLRASAAPSTTARAIWASDWASSHYGYGSAWATGTAPTVRTPSGVAW